MHWQIHSKYPDGSHFPVEECRIFQAFNKGEGTHVDDEVLWRSDGSSFPAEYWSYPQRHDGVAVGAVVTLLDTTERKLAEDALRKKTGLLSGLLASIPDIVFFKDKNGVYLAAILSLPSLSIKTLLQLLVQLMMICSVKRLPISSGSRTAS